jgi:hypothetical protein
MLDWHRTGKITMRADHYLIIRFQTGYTALHGPQCSGRYSGKGLRLPTLQRPFAPSIGKKIPERLKRFRDKSGVARAKPAGGIVTISDFAGMSTLAGVYQSTRTGHDCPLRIARLSTKRLIGECSGSRYSLYFRLQISKHYFYIGIRQSFDDSCRVAFRINLQIVLECGSMGADIFRVQLDVLLSWCHGQPLKMITINATSAAIACIQARRQ